MNGTPLENRSEITYSLRAVRRIDVEKSTPIANLPVVFVGNHLRCLNFAQQNGFKWRSDPKMLFNGYWNSVTPTGEEVSIIPDLHPFASVVFSHLVDEKVLLEICAPPKSHEMTPATTT